jgi:segregation and condensation protein B
MLTPKLEALIYAVEEPITLDQLAALLKDDLLALKSRPAEEPDQSAPSAGDESGEARPVVAEGQSNSARRSPEKTEKAELRALLRPLLDELIAEYASAGRGIEIREVAGGYRMSTKPEHHDLVRAFAKSLKPPVRLSLPALETLAVIAYKQPVTVPEISEIRGVDSSGVIGTLMDRKLITTGGRKAVVGRPMLYKTTKDFLLRFGLKDLHELPSVEEFEKLMGGVERQEELFAQHNAAVPDATGVPEVPEDAASEPLAEDNDKDKDEDKVKADAPQDTTGPGVSADPHPERNDENAAGSESST